MFNSLHIGWAMEMMDRVKSITLHLPTYRNEMQPALKISKNHYDYLFILL